MEEEEEGEVENEERNRGARMRKMQVIQIHMGNNKRANEGN